MVIRIVWAFHMICYLESFRRNEYIKISHTLPSSLHHHLLVCSENIEENGSNSSCSSENYCATYYMYQLNWASKNDIPDSICFNRHFLSRHPHIVNINIWCTSVHTLLYHNCILLDTWHMLCVSTLLFYQHFACRQFSTIKSNEDK